MSETDSEHQIADELDEARRMFERAQQGRVSPLTRSVPDHVLVVLDGSPQDEGSIEAGRAMAKRFSTETSVLDARESGDGDLTRSAIEKIEAAKALPRTEGPAHERILAAAKEVHADIVVVPCPFGRPLDEVGVDSTGTVIDVLLAKSDCSLLVIRREGFRFMDCLKEIVVIVGGECDAEIHAGEVAAGMSVKEGLIRLNLVIDREQFENVRDIVETGESDQPLSKEQFAHRLAIAHRKLHGRLEMTATEWERRYEMQVIDDEQAPPNPLADPPAMLLVVPLEVDDRYNMGLVKDRIARSPHPVMVVPTPPKAAE